MHVIITDKTILAKELVHEVTEHMNLISVNLT